MCNCSTPQQITTSIPEMKLVQYTGDRLGLQAYDCNSTNYSFGLISLMAMQFIPIQDAYTLLDKYPGQFLILPSNRYGAKIKTWTTLPLASTQSLTDTIKDRLIAAGIKTIGQIVSFPTSTVEVMSQLSSFETATLQNEIRKLLELPLIPVVAPVTEIAPDEKQPEIGKPATKKSKKKV
jgi:hypothetical protein